jgi:hypothetical protein
MTAMPGPISVTLTTNRDDYRSGDPVEFRVTFGNTSNVPVDLYFSSGKTFDITVTTPAGDEVWRWAAGRFFTQAIREFTLAPGEETTYTAAWDQHTIEGAVVPVGRYHAVATVPIEHEPASPPVIFTIQE